MDVVLGEAHQGADAGLLVVADEQTAGRGRRGHAWASPPGAGLYFSLLLRPPLDRGNMAKASAPSATLEGTAPSVAGLITLAAGVAVGEGITTATGLDVSLKWPNDVLVERRKLAGILAEAVALGTPAQSIVLGIGINVDEASFPPAIATRATSIATELGRPVDRGEVLAAVLVALSEQYRRLLEARYDDVLGDWRARSPWASGAQVEWDSPHGPMRGITTDVDNTGALLVRTPERVERIIAGEVRWYGLR